ncbi:sulfonate transport system permease protein [Rhodococcus sp. 27YEA15]|uniref:ABC transporter permease n=1 Tax=Rhodococcus sp. 27YEA15 TaxID=3156259 RepID=UPI003C7AD96E
MASGKQMTASPIARRAGLVLLEVLIPVVLVATWWFTTRHSTSRYFPPLSKITTSFHDMWVFSHFWSDAVPSLGRLFLGLSIAVVIGIVVGLVLGLTPLLSDALAPILEFLRATPGVALLPAAFLLLGVGPTMQVSLIAFGSVWPVLLNTVDGVRGIDPVVEDVARSYHIGFADRMLRIVLPAASPQIMVGIRMALSIGVTVIIFTEMIGATNGIGYQILQAQRSYAVADMWSGIIMLGVVGYLLNLAFLGVDRVVLHWHRRMHAAVR